MLKRSGARAFTLLVVFLGAIAKSEAQTATPLVEPFAPLKGGPLEVQPQNPTAGLITGQLSERKAKKIAAHVVGGNLQPGRAWHVVATDHEFMGNVLKSRPCWLIEFPQALRAALPPPRPRFSYNPPPQEKALYALVDAYSGYFWEYFTLPRVAWWKQVPFGRERLLNRYALMGDRGNIASTPPQSSATRALSIALSAYAAWDFFEQDWQIVCRYFAYTSLNEGPRIRRLEGEETIPASKRRPIWNVSFLQKSVQIMHFKGHEFNLLIDDATGNVLGAPLSR